MVSIRVGVFGDEGMRLELEAILKIKVGVAQVLRE